MTYWHITFENGYAGCTQEEYCKEEDNAPFEDLAEQYQDSFHEYCQDYSFAHFGYDGCQEIEEYEEYLDYCHYNITQLTVEEYNKLTT